MFDLELFISDFLGVGDRPAPSRQFALRGEAQTKKADVVEYPEVLHHVGLLVNEPPGMAGLPFI
jgi:hypothetical protein